MTKFAKLLPVVAFLAGIPVIVAGVIRVESNSSDVSLWLPDEGKDRREYSEFVNRFGADDFVFVAWEGCGWDDPRLDELAGRLSHLRSSDGGLLFDHCQTGPEIVERLDASSLRLSRKQALERLKGIFVSQDLQTTGILLHLSESGRAAQHATIAQTVRAAESCGVTRDELRMGGSAYEAAMADAESYHSFRNEIPIIFVITASLAWMCFRDIRVALLALMLGTYCYFLAIALIYYSGGYMNAVLIAMPVLIYVLTLSGTVHLLNYYADIVTEKNAAHAGWLALGVGWLPCSLAIASTSLGMSSLSVSGLQPVRQFGYYSSTLLLTSLVIVLAVLPTMLERYSTPLAAWARSYTVRNGERRASRWQNPIVDFILARPNVLATIGLAGVFLLGSGMARLTGDVKLENLFREETELVQNYRWLEREFGPLIPVEVLLKFEASADVDPMLRAELIAVVHTRLKQLDDIGGVISAATFLPALPRRHQTIERAQYRSRLEQRRAELVEEGYLAQVRDGEFWRISARIPAIHDDDYEVFVRKVQDCVEQTRGAWVEATGGRVAPDAVQASYTGLLPLVHGAQRQLLHDLVKSFSLALVLIFPIMVLALGSFVFGLAAMIPNVAPVAIVFGAMGWLNIPVDIGAMLTASVALGIAIDDTLHFLTWYRRGFSAGKTSGEAVRYAFQKCSTAMIQTTIITSLGMLVLVRSNYVPTGHFALLMALMLSAALIGDLLLLPAILAGPLRRVLQRGPAETC